MKLALAQMKMDEDTDKNYEKSLRFIEKASEKNADIILFPELQLSRFFPQYPHIDSEKYLETLDSRYINGFSEKCMEKQISAIINLYIKIDNKNYDMCLFIDKNGETIGNQKMVHIARFEKFYEKDYYTPSEDGFNVFETEHGKIGIVICFDRHYPESIRTEVLKGADLILIPTANTYDEPTELFKWEIKVQAYQNSVYIGMCNRVGTEDEMDFSGESVIVDYNGETIKTASIKDEELLISDIKLSEACETRKKRPYTSLRRKEFYL